MDVTSIYQSLNVLAIGIDVAGFLLGLTVLRKLGSCMRKYSPKEMLSFRNIFFDIEISAWWTVNLSNLACIFAIGKLTERLAVGYPSLLSDYNNLGWMLFHTLNGVVILLYHLIQIRIIERHFSKELSHG